MDATEPTALELSAASRWSGHALPHELAQALSLILPLLPLDCRARATCVCRAWQAAAAHPSLWEELSFAPCTARVNDATLAALCARAGASLHTLSLESDACKRVSSGGMVLALRDGGCTGLRRLSMTPLDLRNAEEVQQLAAACPRLTHTACTVISSMSDAAAALAALPRPLSLKCFRPGNSEGLMQLAECLRSNATLTSLSLIHVNIDDAGATQLAESLRVNTTLKSLNLNSVNIGATGVTQLAESLRVKSALTSLKLVGSNNNAGATQLAECLRVNATLTSLDLSHNVIQDASATQLAECLRVNATLKSLVLRGSISDSGALRAACPPQCTPFV